MTSNNKREIIICGLGTRGDIHPLVGLARLFVDRGHAVTFLSNDKFKDTIEGSGIAFHSIGTEAQYHSLYDDWRAWDMASKPAELAFDRYYGPAFVPAFEFVRKRFEQNRHLLVIGLSVLNGARAAARRYSVPYILITLSPSFIPSRIRPDVPLTAMLPGWLPPYFRRQLCGFLMYRADRYMVRRGHIRRLNETRKQLGLEPVTRVLRHDYHQEDLHIGFFPEWFGMRPDDWPRQFKLVGFPLSGDDTRGVSTGIDRFIEARGAPVLFATGTGVYNADDYFRESVEACNRLSLPCLLVGGGAPPDCAAGNPNVLHVDYADFNSVLPRCRAIVHHGGIGTLSQAIRAGIPQIIRPLLWDQPDNARKIAKLGLGLPIPKDQYRASRVAETLNALFKSKFESRIMRFSENIKKSRCLEKAYQLIVRV